MEQLWELLSLLVIDFGSAGSPSLMIPGISKALITTAVGMLIAIPALISYRYFQRVVQDYIAELEQQPTLFHASLFTNVLQSCKNIAALVDG